MVALLLPVALCPSIMAFKGGTPMKIHIDETPGLDETEIVIRCAHTDEQILKMLALLRAFDHKLTGLRDGRTFILDAGDILYADTADKRVFLYTADGVYETPLRLYELEERLAGCGFFRAGKSLILNFHHIRSLCPEFGGRMQATMSNGESAYISRQYVSFIHEKLGI